VTIRRLLPVVALVLALIFVIGVLPALAQDGTPCQDCPVSFTTPSILDPGSVGAAEISQLFYIILGIATVVFVGVEGLLFYSIFRFRNRPASEAVQVHGNTKLEIAWTIVPAIILVILLGFTLRTMASVRAPVGDNALQIKVIGHQWWWEFQYPEWNIKTANELIVPVGRPIQVELQSFDVQHGFWAPQLFGKMDALPGHTNKMNFTVTEAGNYGAQCTQMCGTEHAQMRFEIIAMSASQFSDWALAQSKAADAPTDDAATRGQALVIKNCAACHAVNGTDAAGAVGPNLTHLWSRTFIAGGILPLNDDNLTRWVTDAPKLKPGIVMPNFGDPNPQTGAAPIMTGAEISDVVAYLKTLK
jgi:cytochrome c oxidase subunit II